MDSTRIADPALDAAWDRVGTEVDDAKRLDAVKRANEMTADLVPGLPFYPGLALLVRNTSRLAGPISNNVPSPFYNLNEWWCRAGRC
jgi:ABC-type transport system substrate-binding protein